MFGAFFSSRQKARPITLFLFKFGDLPTAYFAHTDADRPITREGIVYTSVPIQHGNIVASGSLDKSLLEVKTARTTGAASLFASYPPTSVISLRIMRGNANDPDGQFVTTWFGEVKSCKLDKSEAVFACEPLSTRLLNPGLRRNYQIGCPHALYSSACGVNPASFMQTGVVASISGQHVTLVDGWNAGPVPVAKFLGGMVQWAGVSSSFDRRSIIRVEGANTLHLGGIPAAVGVGTTISILPGCNHQQSDCLDIYHNSQNFGGCPYIPYINPIGLVDNFF
jgi:hypothetical protein